jgi:hypothetical protein
MFALVLLTFVVGFSLGISRFISVRKKQVDPRYYKLMSGHVPPEYIIKLGRNFSNLLEVPILFYVLCVLMVVLKIENTFMLVLAWAFVALRISHSFIHITYNHPVHRFITFLISGCLILFMWFKFVFMIN